MDLELQSRRGLRPRARQIDRDLWLWFCRARHCHEHEGGPRVSKRLVQEEAKRVFHCAGITTFKASDGWYWRWLHRWRRLDPSSTSGKRDRGTENVQNKTAEETLPKTVTTGENPKLEVTLSSTIETPASKLSTPSIKILEHSSIRLATVNCGDTLLKDTQGGRIPQFSEQAGHQSRLVCENNAETQYWSEYENGALSQDMMDLGKLTEHHFYHEENLQNSQVDQHNSIQEPDMTLNIPGQCIGNGLSSGQILEERLSEFDLAFNNQNTISGKFMSYDIHLSNEEVCLLNENMVQSGDHSFPQMQGLDSNQQIPMQNSDAHMYFDPGQLHLSQDDNQFCNNVLPLQEQNQYDKVSNSTGFGANSPAEQLPIPGNLDQSYLNQTSQTLLNCSAIEDLNPSLQSSKEVYDVIASMASSFLSTSNSISDPFCMPNDQSTFFESKNGHAKNVFNNSLQIDPLDDIGSCRDIDSRTDTNLMDVVLDPLQGDGHQYVGSCDSGIDVSPLATEDTGTDYSHLPQNGNPFDSNLSLLTSTRDEDCNMFLNFNSDDSVGITDLISLGDTDDCMKDDDSLPEDYLEFIDNYNDHSSSQQTTKDNASDVSSMDRTEKSPASPGGSTAKARTGGERYLPYFKQRVLKYAAAHTFKAAAARFNVNVDSITLWALKTRETVIKQNPEKHLLLWLRKRREIGHSVTREQLLAKVKQLVSAGNGVPKLKESGWFYVWAKRVLNSNDDGSEEVKEANKASKAFYPPAFKTEVALLAESTSKYNASLVFSVARKRVYEWLAALRDITEDPSEKNKSIEDTESTEFSESTEKETSRPDRAVVQLKHRGRELTSSKIDNELLEWFHIVTATAGRPTGSEVRSKAVELFRSHGHNEINCSHGWYRRWCSRHGLDIRHSGDEEVLAWCLQELDKGRNVSQRDLLTAAHSILSGKHKSHFKASAGWARRFAWRHGALFSRWPQLGPDTSLPSLLARRAATFRARIQGLVKECSWSAAVIGTMDEVPLSLTASGTSGRGTSLLHRPWPESVHATVVLGCLANGELLPPTVVLKGEGDPEKVTVGKTTVLVFRQQDAIVDENVLLQWIDLVWFRSGVARITKPADSDEMTNRPENLDASADSLLILDSYEPHGSPKVRADLAARRCRLALIPAGCGSILLPLASSAIRVFRTALEKDQHHEHRTGSQPLLTTVASRVARAHMSLATKKISWLSFVLPLSTIGMSFQYRLCHSTKKVKTLGTDRVKSAVKF